MMDDKVIGVHGTIMYFDILFVVKKVSGPEVASILHSTIVTTNIYKITHRRHS